MTQIILLILLATGFILALRLKALAYLAARPLVTLVGATLIGIGWRAFGLTEVDAELARGVTQFGLGMLGFFAAQQCRLSRLHRISPSTFRLAIFAPIAFLATFSIVGFALVPGLSLLATVLVGAAVVLGGAPSLATPLLTAPIEKDTKATARLESAAVLSATLPISVLVEAGATPGISGLATQPVFLALGGFAVGGAMGLLSGRFVPVAKHPIPVMPFLVAAAVYAASSLMGFNPVMATVAAGILFSEECSLPGDVRTRLWRVTESMATPVALIALGVLMGPLLYQADLLVWIAAAVAVVAARASARYLSLQRLTLSPQDRGFLIWYGGAPGIPAALMLVGFMASPATLIDEKALSFGVVATYMGIALTRLQSRPLTSRLVQATARARKRRYASA